MATAMETTAQPVTRRALPARRFRLLDAMILVAATVVGFAFVGGIAAMTNGGLSWSSLYEEVAILMKGQAREGAFWRAIVIGAEAMTHFSPVVAMWGLALIPISLIGPRPRWRRMARQPGLTAVSAMALAVALIGMPCVVLGMAFGIEAYAYSSADGIWVISPMLIGMGVLTAWMTLLVGRRWRAERSWIDRLGRAIGAFWIISAMGMAVLLGISEASRGCYWPVQDIQPPAAQGP